MARMNPDLPHRENHWWVLCLSVITVGHSVVLSQGTLDPLKVKKSLLLTSKPA